MMKPSNASSEAILLKTSCLFVQTEFEEVLNSAKWQPLAMRMRAKKETYNNVTRTKVHVMAPNKVNFVPEGKLMLAEIAKYNLDLPTN